MTNLILMASSLTRNATGLMVVLVLLFGISATISTAQTYTDLHDFNCSKEGCNPQFPAQLAQGRDGNLYGTMPKGGTFNFGTFFKATTGGIVSVPYTFDGNNGNGRVPRSGVTLGTDGYLYGATLSGGQAAGAIFKIAPAGTISTLYSFTGQNGAACPSTGKPDGGSPYPPPIRGKDGFYYGVTSIGTAYRITSSGTFIPLCSPSVLIPFGALSPVVQAIDGNFYGTSTSGNGTEITDDEGFRPRQIQSWAENPEQLLAASERNDLVREAVLRLPPKYRVVVLLRDINQLSTEDSAALGLSIPALKARFLRGRLMLRESLAPHFVCTENRSSNAQLR